jgi:hypothetical protein
MNPAQPLLPDSKDSASEKWMRHYVWGGCPICEVAETADKSRFCPNGKLLRAAALAEMKAIPKPKKKPTSTVFNPAMKGHR